MKHIFLAAAVVAVCTVTAAQASPHIRITPCAAGIDYHDCAIININGKIVDGDAEEFLARTNDIKEAVVELNSPGGQLVEGLAIGERIHERKFATSVASGAICYSACASIWLAGRPALNVGDPPIAFHSPYLETTPDTAHAPSAAYMGAYLYKLGMKPRDIVKMLGETPNDIVFLGSKNGFLTISPPVRLPPKTVEENIFAKYVR